MIRRLSILPVLLLIVAALAPPRASFAQQEEPPDDQADVHIIIDNQVRGPIRLAFPAANESLTAAMTDAGQEMVDTLRQDLELAGIFSLQGPEELAVLAMTGDEARDRELYRSLGNEALLEVSALSEGDRMVLEGRLTALDSGQQILGKRYRGDPAAGRRVAHTFADEIVQYFSGRRGVALTSIAFYSDREALNQIKEIFIMDYDGHNQRPVTDHETLSLGPAWSPQGDAIAYTSYFSGLPGLYLVEFPTGRKIPVVTDGSLNASPSFSPDGRRIVFARTVDDNTEIFICDRSGSDLRRLTHSSGIDTNPAWSPTGREIAFTSSRAGSPQIYTMDAEGANLRRITFQGRYNDGAAWSPDGTRLAYASRTGNRFDIHVTDLVTLETQVLTSAPGSHETPSFSPDGRRIAFASTREGGSVRTQIMVMDLDGSNLRQLTSQGNNWAPSWSGYPPR